MSRKTFLSSSILVLAAALSLCMPHGVFAATDTAGQVLSGIDSYASRLTVYLSGVKADLEQDIIRLQTEEASTTQTKIGSAINEVEGDNFVPQTRPTGTPGQTAQRLAEQVLVFFITVALFILAHSWLLYIVLAIVVIYLLRLVWRMVGRQQF